jgi:hypothetical protein
MEQNSSIKVAQPTLAEAIMGITPTLQVVRTEPAFVIVVLPRTMHVTSLDFMACLRLHARAFCLQHKLGFAEIRRGVQPEGCVVALPFTTEEVDAGRFLRDIAGASAALVKARAGAIKQAQSALGLVEDGNPGYYTQSAARAVTQK